MAEGALRIYKGFGEVLHFEYSRLQDLYSGESPRLFHDQLVIPPYRFYWLNDQGSR